MISFYPSRYTESRIIGCGSFVFGSASLGMGILQYMHAKGCEQRGNHSWTCIPAIGVCFIALGGVSLIPSLAIVTEYGILRILGKKVPPDIPSTPETEALLDSSNGESDSESVHNDSYRALVNEESESEHDDNDQVHIDKKNELVNDDNYRILVGEEEESSS